MTIEEIKEWRRVVRNRPMSIVQINDCKIIDTLLAEVERLENYITTWRMDYTKMELEQTKLTIATEALESLISANTQRITTARYISRTALERIKE